MGRIPYELVLTNITSMCADIRLVSRPGKVVGAKLTPNEIGQINKLVEAGLYLNPSDFIRDAVREKLAAIKVIQYRDLDYETARKEVAGSIRLRCQHQPGAGLRSGVQDHGRSGEGRQDGGSERL